MARYSVGTIFRFLIPSAFSTEIKKVIYLDSDIIVNLNLKELWQIELDEKIFAVVPETENHVPTNPLHGPCRDGSVKADDYFNAGILLMNLERFSLERDTVNNGIRVYGEHPEYDCPDQDILNYCFSTETVKLPQKFNVLVEYARMNNDFETADRICHYITSSRGRGYGLDMRDPFNRLWLKYFVKTPWFDEETIGRLYAGVQQMNVGFKQSMVNLTSIMSGKTRGFFAAPNDVEALKKLFAIRDDEEIILAENQDSLNELLDAMKRARGRKVFFIMLPNFPFQMLIQAGFASGRDFLNGLEFLSEAQGVPMNSYPLIQAM